MANAILVKKMMAFFIEMRRQQFTDEELSDALEEVLPQEIGRALSPRDPLPPDENGSS